MVHKRMYIEPVILTGIKSTATFDGCRIYREKDDESSIYRYRQYLTGF